MDSKIVQHELIGRESKKNLMSIVRIDSSSERHIQRHIFVSPDRSQYSQRLAALFLITSASENRVKKSIKSTTACFHANI